jgi:NAD(P)-dependent dehydrogenase (short-subunit alcohol dehydrogenase family)
MGSSLNGVAVVTGASRINGIGRAAAVRLARDGADVVLLGRAVSNNALGEQEKKSEWNGAHSVAKEVRDLGRKSLFVECDLANATQVREAFQIILDHFGRIDFLVNNAAMGDQQKVVGIVDLEEEVWSQMVNVNLTGAFLTAKYAARAMIDGRKGGAIVNVSSLAGRAGMPNFGAYCASKFGIIGLTQQLALELARFSIRVNCICPGATDTAMLDGVTAKAAGRLNVTKESVLARIRSKIPLGRIGLPDDQAAAIAFLVGPDAAFITGQALNVDGGMRMD